MEHGMHCMFSKRLTVLVSVNTRLVYSSDVVSVKEEVKVTLVILYVTLAVVV